MEQHQSREKYGEEDASTEGKANCLSSSMHRKTYAPLTKSDLGSHDSSDSAVWSMPWVESPKLVGKRENWGLHIMKYQCERQALSSRQW